MKKINLCIRNISTLFHIFIFQNMLESNIKYFVLDFLKFCFTIFISRIIRRSILYLEKIIYHYLKKNGNDHYMKFEFLEKSIFFENFIRL